MDSQFIYLWSMRCVNISVGIRSVLIISSWTAGPPASGSVVIGLAVSQCQ